MRRDKRTACGISITSQFFRASVARSETKDSSTAIVRFLSLWARISKRKKKKGNATSAKGKRWQERHDVRFTTYISEPMIANSTHRHIGARTAKYIGCTHTQVLIGVRSADAKKKKGNLI